jgi:hypothetical protein
LLDSLGPVSGVLVVGDPVLPPSRFGAGYTVGAPASTGPAPAPLVQSAAVSHPGAVYSHDGHSAAGVNALAVVAFVLVLLFGPFVVALTIPMAFVARSQISRSGQSGAGLAKAALALSAIYLAVGAVVLILALVVRP